MSADSRFRDAALFYVLALGMAVGVTALTPALGDGVLLATMFTPLLAVLAMRLLIVRDGWTLAAWADIGLHRPGFRYWPLALVLPLIVLLPGYLLVWGTGMAGLVVPLILNVLEVKRHTRMTLFAPALVLIGGLALRAIFVAAGQAHVVGVLH